MASIENKCFKLDHARSLIRLIQDHDFDINYKMRNRNPDSETRFGFRIKKCAPALKGVGMIRAEIGLKNRQIINETYSFRCFLIL